MIIDKLSDSSYKLSDIEKVDIFVKFLTLFDIKHTIHSSSVILYNINSLQNYQHWRDNLPHPYVDYETALDIFNKFASMFLYLEKHNLQLCSLDENKLVVVNNDIIIPTNMDEILAIKNNKISVKAPYDKNNKLLTLALRKNKSLPMTLSYKSPYSSLALLIIDIFIGLKDSNPSELKIINQINVVYGTRLYWLLCNLIHSNINQRAIINI